MASSNFQSLYNLTVSYLHSILYNKIPSSISNQLLDIPTWWDRVSAALPPHLSISSLFSNPAPENLLTLILPFLILLVSMSTWGRPWNFGRYSPFATASPVGASPPTVTENDYHYIGPEDIVDPPHSHSIEDNYRYSHPHNVTRIDNSGQHSPDILVLQHLGTTYPLHLPAFSIGEGRLKVGDLRRLAAEETKTDDPRRVKLFYKGKILKDDHRACCDEGLKQNSVLRCVVTEAGHHTRREDGESSSSADSDEMLESGMGGPRVEVGDASRESRSKRKGHRGGRRKPRGAGDGGANSSVEALGSNYLNPQDSRPATRSYSPASPRAGSPRASHQSHSNPQPPPITTTVPHQQPPSSSPPPSTSSSRPKPQIPVDILDTLSHTLHFDLVPKCKHFLAHPPSDAKSRDMEYKRLSETIFAQVTLKLDAVETEGDEGRRTRRRQLVKETQSILAELDRAAKAGFKAGGGG